MRRSPAAEASFSPAAPRLACVKPVASVHPEPGSNSPLLVSCFFFFSLQKKSGKTLVCCFCLHKMPQDHRSQTLRTLLIGSRIDRVHFCSLVLLLMSIVIVSMCSFFSGFTIFRPLAPKSGCKVNTVFVTMQIFAAFLTAFNFCRFPLFFAFSSRLPLQPLILESECKVRHFFVTLQTFSTIFMF